MNYNHHYKWMLLIPVILLIASVGVIIYTSQTTGSFVYKGVSLSGGVSATATIPSQPSVEDIRLAVINRFPGSDVQVRQFTSSGVISYVIEAANLHEDEKKAASELEAFLKEEFQAKDVSLESTGPALGDAFFTQTILGVLLAFLWMGWVVYLYFGSSKLIKTVMGVLALLFSQLVKNGLLDGSIGVMLLFAVVVISMIIYFFSSVPAGAVILAATSTIVFTVAVIDLLGVRLSTAGVAAFLMLIGYSVDTDILLSTRVLKGTGSISERLFDAFKTGFTMQVTTLVAVLAAFLLTNSEVIKQIMLILIIGLVGDVIFTWLQNAGILYWFEQRRHKR